MHSPWASTTTAPTKAAGPRGSTSCLSWTGRWGIPRGSVAGRSVVSYSYVIRCSRGSPHNSGHLNITNNKSNYICIRRLIKKCYKKQTSFPRAKTLSSVPVRKYYILPYKLTTQTCKPSASDLNLSMWP